MTILRLITLSLLTLSCNESEYRQEQINKLRALGVSNAPVVTKPSVEGETPLTVTATVHLALPLDKTVSLEPFEDAPSSTGITLPSSQISVDTSSEQYDDNESFRYYTVNVNLVVPTESFLVTPLGPKPGIQVRYGIAATVEGDTELIVGTFLMYKKDSPELDWIAPSVDIKDLTDGSIFEKSKTDQVELTLTNTNDEEYKAGWFVSTGKISNRRSYTPYWTELENGKQTLIATVRGRKSKSFAIKVIEINVSD